jgi:hypothetical protein
LRERPNPLDTLWYNKSVISADSSSVFRFAPPRAKPVFRKHSNDAFSLSFWGEKRPFFKRLRIIYTIRKFKRNRKFSISDAYTKTHICRVFGKSILHKWPCKTQIAVTHKFMLSVFCSCSFFGYPSVYFI